MTPAPSSSPALPPALPFSAADLALRVEAVAGTTRLRAALALLASHPHCPALAVVDEEGRIIGLLGRRQPPGRWWRRFRSGAWTVARQMCSPPLVVEAGSSLAAVAERVAEGEAAALAEGFVIAENGRYLGIGRVGDLLAALAGQAHGRQQDLERSRRAEALALRAAEESGQAKSTFLANLSHEIRTPLNGVLANLEVLGHGALGPEQREVAQAATAAAQALAGIIGDILDLSRIEAGTLTLESRPMQPAAVLRDLSILAAGRAARQKLAYGLLIEPSAWFATRGDPVRLRQVVMNLIDNALKFTARGGVFLSVLRQDGPSPEQAELWVEVADTGAGFAPEQTERLFAPFSQEDQSITRLHGGAGLGLPLCRAIAVMMGGRIEADGLPGQGASFWCRLPLPVGLDGNVMPPSLEGVAVLVVSADGPRRERLIGALLGFGMLVTGVAGAGAALDSLERAASVGRPFDVVLLPVEEDEELLELPSRFHGLNVVPVMLVARDNPQARRAGFRAGFCHHAGLPARPRDLAWAVAAALGRTPALPAAERSGPDLASLRAALRGAGRILVVDDNAMNREVAERQLRLLGLSCVSVDGAAAALNALDLKPFDLVLCDLQMPGMDGLAFARQVRRREAESSSPRLILVAMTANVLAGDVERCLQAGMDDYLPKPVRIERLAELLSRHLEGVEPPSPSPALVVDGSGGQVPVIDRDALAAILGDTSLRTQVDLLGVFLECYPPLAAELRAAVATESRGGLRRAAHTAKGAARNAAAIALGDALHWLEMNAATAPWADLAARVDQTETLFGDVCAVIEDLRRRAAG